jgi:hypothetical protein
MQNPTDQDDEALSRMASWAVYQCVNGCVHIRLQNLTLTFSAGEFAQLVKLLGDAYVRLGVRAAVASSCSH